VRAVADPKPEFVGVRAIVRCYSMKAGDGERLLQPAGNQCPEPGWREKVTEAHGNSIVYLGTTAGVSTNSFRLRKNAEARCRTPEMWFGEVLQDAAGLFGCLGCEMFQSASRAEGVLLAERKPRQNG
jgi:hypothetical protein